jgi:speckle-type POZ protein
VPDSHSKFGVYVQRVDDAKKDCPVNIKSLTVVNRDVKMNLDLVDKMYSAMKYKQARGWSPSFGDEIGIQTLKLWDVLLDENGWLHNGTLRIKCRLGVGTELLECRPSGHDFEPLSELSIAFHNIFQSGKLADVGIRAGGSRERLNAHSQILAARSSVFATMLSTPMREGTEKEIDLQDLDMETVTAMITYLYTGAVNPPDVWEDDDAVVALLEAAHRFDVTDLANRCSQVLCDRLTVTNVLERFRMADLLACGTLRSRCLDYIREKMDQVQVLEDYSAWGCRHPALLMEIIAAISPPASTPQAKRMRLSKGEGRGKAA